MKVKFYLIMVLLSLLQRASAQDCSTLSVTYTTSESRCVATGSITVNVTGGSGSYSYKAVGPITTPTTSSNIITGLPTGNYAVYVKDVSTGCVKEVDSAFVPGSYSDPRFGLVKTDAGCSGNDGTISVAGQQFGRSPFNYSIIAPSPSNVGATSSTGNFTGLTPGEYSIQLQDSCGGIQVRRITIENYSWWLDSLSVTQLGCDSAKVFIRVRDNRGHVSPDPAFSGFGYGYVRGPGDTLWSGSGSFHAIIAANRSVTIVFRDACGNVQSTIWTVPDSVKPSLSAVSFADMNCTTFTASVTGQNLAPKFFCLYNSHNDIVTCNTTGTFGLLPYGSYCIKVTNGCYDTTISRCFTMDHPLPSVDPNVAISAQNCTGFTATITGQQSLTQALYCLYDSSHNQVACDSNGVFTNLTYGSYCITVKDGCYDTTIQRCFTVLKPQPALTSYSINTGSCSSFGVTINGNNLNTPRYCLYDSTGQVITCDSTGIFTGLSYGSYCVRAISCGDTTNSICFSAAQPVPSLGNGVSILNRRCGTFGVGVWGQTNLGHPSYCLYTTTDSLITCSATGQFDSIPYGSYCIKVHDSCYDTTITRCFTELGIPPSVNGTLQLLSSNCTTVSFKANGSHLTNPTYKLYDAANNLIATNNTGTFSNQPYGSYCVEVVDGCVDTTMRVCQTFAPVRGITLTTSKSCTIGNTFIDVRFTNGNGPFHIKLYHPNGSVLVDTVTSANPFRAELTPVPVSIQYKVIGTDNCGNTDSAFVIPDVNNVTKSITVRAKCPSATWPNGAGDLSATVNSNYYSVLPQIIKKDGAAFVRSYSSVSGNAYNFADLEPAQYIVQYTQQTCNGSLYDTVTVPPYAYPTQGQSAIYQCDNNSFSLGADVHGGVSPYTFQIIGSLPSTPSIVTSAQNSPIFSINNGTIYSLVRLRSIDACGNATLNDVSVLPLQNISMSATNTCFYQNITLSVDTIPNAKYYWYRKTTAVDSVLLDSSLTYNLPFFVPEQVGDYVCKVIVNDGCVTRLTSFTLDGNCYSLLPASVQLRGSVNGTVHQLSWTAAHEAGVLRYVVERKRAQDAGYQTLGTVPVRNGNYYFNDADPGAGDNDYRIRLVYANKNTYSNIITLRHGGSSVTVYPNPVKRELHVAISSEQTGSYRIEIVAANGQLVYSNTVRGVVSANVTYTRNKEVPGVYLLRIIDTVSGAVEVRKLVFE